MSLRDKLIEMNFGDRFSQGGWLIFQVGEGVKGLNPIFIFTQTIKPEMDYYVGRKLDDPPIPLHIICSTMYHFGVKSYYCVPSISVNNDTSSITWDTKLFGIPSTSPYTSLISTFSNISLRKINYKILRYHIEANQIPLVSLSEEFTKKYFKLHFQNQFMCEMLDVDGIFWGEKLTYPVEIREVIVIKDKSQREFFEINLGPHAKLSFYDLKKDKLDALFFVKEINNLTDRQLVNWWWITFKRLAFFSSLAFFSMRNFRQGGSTTINIPKSQFSLLKCENLSEL